jgi:hypothetical protein
MQINSMPAGARYRLDKYHDENLWWQETNPRLQLIFIKQRIRTAAKFTETHLPLAIRKACFAEVEDVSNFGGRLRLIRELRMDHVSALVVAAANPTPISAITDSRAIEIINCTIGGKHYGIDYHVGAPDRRTSSSCLPILNVSGPTLPAARSVCPHDF